MVNFTNTDTNNNCYSPCYMYGGKPIPQSLHCLMPHPSLNMGMVDF